MMNMGSVFRVPAGGTIRWKMDFRLLVIVIGVLVCASSSADNLGHEDARELRSRGEILPLSVILEKIGRQLDGRVIGTELEHDGARMVYELEYLSGGEVWELQVDATTGELLSRERD